MAGVRSRTRPAGRRDAVALPKRQGCVASAAVRTTGWAAAVLRSGDRDRAHAPARLPLALAPDGGLRSVDPDGDARPSRRRGPHDALAEKSAAGYRVARRPSQRTAASHRRHTGLSIVGEGEWAVAKHGGRGTRGWKKLHLGVDRSGAIVAHALTEATLDDATVGIALIRAAAGAVVSVTGDGAYDTVAFYAAGTARHARVVVPPTLTAKVTQRGPRSTARDRAITEVETLGRRQWKTASGYHQQARVENAFFRYKTIIGDGLRARRQGGGASKRALRATS